MPENVNFFVELIFKSVIYESRNLIKTIQEAEVVMVGSGNTFHLVAEMQKTGIMKAIRKKVMEGTTVAGLREGSMPHLENHQLRIIGNKSLRLFCFDKAPRELEPGTDISFLLKTQPA